MGSGLISGLRIRILLCCQIRIRIRNMDGPRIQVLILKSLVQLFWFFPHEMNTCLELHKNQRRYILFAKGFILSLRIRIRILLKLFWKC